jgi:hypothetical protein
VEARGWWGALTRGDAGLGAGHQVGGRSARGLVLLLQLRRVRVREAADLVERVVLHHRAASSFLLPAS